ncbi:lipoyl(octanoyl) transferase LipB [Candidatus Karelsulcia muelleri]
MLNKNRLSCYIKSCCLTDGIGLWNIQQQLLKLKIKVMNKKDNFIMFVEHNNVYTFGPRTKCYNFLRFYNNKTFKKINILQVDRGGKVTYHGPGQIVIYFILELLLFNYDVNIYLRFIENILLLTLLKHQIMAFRIINQSGIWVINYQLFAKIGFIGLKISHYITMHGLALNINTDLKIFCSIWTCGINNNKYGVTSIEKETSINQLDTKRLTQTINKALLFFST